MFRRLSSDGRRDRLRAKAPPGPLRDFYDVPEPARDCPVREASFLALDLETTGLDAGKDQILSIGFVPLDDGGITLAGARQILVRPTVDLGQSVVFHGITHDAATQGIPIESALTEALGALRGRILVAHSTGIETSFLSEACRNVFGVDLVVQTSFDTMVMAQHLMDRRHGGGGAVPGAYRLQSARDTFGLPRYRAHDALVDALACGELFLAQTAILADRGRSSVGALQRVLR